MNTCKHCGAILPTTGDLQNVIGQEHAKRALEVALAGKHSIAFIGNGEARTLAAIASRLGLGAWAEQPCPCGFFGGLDGKECTCSLATIVKWRKRKAWQNAMQADIMIEVPAPNSYQAEAWLSGKRGEQEAAIVERAQSATDRPLLALDEAGRMLMRAALDKLHFDSDRINRILRLAQTIAALAHSDHIATWHLAEAIQYRPRGG